MQLGMLRLAFVAGLVLAALSASSLVAWKLGFDPALGPPLVWHLYDPLAVVGWGRSWGLTAAYRPLFLSGLSLALLPMMLPLAVLRLRELYGPMRQPHRDADEGLGRPEDLLKRGRVGRRPPGVVIGRDRKGVLRDGGDAHVLILGATRSGKGRGHVVPTMLSHPGSILAFDPKGELAAISGRRRAELGAVFVIDPTDRHSAAFNPLLELRDGPALYGDGQMTAKMLMAGGDSAHDPFWEQAAGSIATALLVHVRQGDEPTLAHLWRLATDLEAHRYPASDDPFVAPVLDGLRRLDARIRGSILTTLTTRLSFLGDPILQRATATSSFRAADLQGGSEPLTVFLSIPVAHGRRLRPLTRLLLQSLLNPLLHSQTHLQDGRAKERGLLALLDEFPQLGHLDFIENGLAACAGYGIRAALVCQDEDQIRSIYGQHQSITANCGTICCIPGFSHESLDTVTRWGGERTQVTSSKQRQVGALRAPSVGEMETRIGVLNPRDLIRRGRDEVLVFMAGCDPTWLKKVHYDEEKEFRGTFDGPDHLAIETLPTEQRPAPGRRDAVDDVDLDMREILR